MTIEVNINCPDLTAAVHALAAAIAGGNAKPSAAAAPAPVPANPMPPAMAPTYPGAAPAGMPANGAAPAAQFGSATPAPVQTPAPPVGQTGPAAAPGFYNPGTAPLTTAPGFTMEQVSKAGADFITANPAKMPELMALLGQYGVQTVNALRPDQLGAFATQLRGMGAKI